MNFFQVFSMFNFARKESFLPLSKVKGQVRHLPRAGPPNSKMCLKRTFDTAPAVSKNKTQFKSGQKRLKSNHLVRLV